MFKFKDVKLSQLVASFAKNNAKQIMSTIIVSF